MEKNVKINPKISVLLPVYNCEKYIEESVNSILNQTYTDFELIIIDDKSTDTTCEIIKKYSDKRIILIEKEKNTGYTNSLNYGISIAQADYIARMDGDDVSMPTRFEEQMKVMENNPEIIVCGTNAKVLGSEKQLKRPEKHIGIFLDLYTSNSIIHPTVLIRKSALINSGYNVSTEPAEDYDLWCRLIFKGQFYNIQKPLLQYRMHDLNISVVDNTNQRDIFLKTKVSLFEKSGFEFTNSEGLLVKEHIIYNKKFESANFVNLILYLKRVKKDTNFSKYLTLKQKNLLANHLREFTILKFAKQNKFAENLKYFKYYSTTELFFVITYYFEKQFKFVNNFL